MNNGIRLAQLDDAAEILEIYRPYVEGSAVSFETELPSLFEFRARMADIQKQFPWIVSEKLDGGRSVITGYAYASPHRVRKAYAWSVESTVYVHPNHRQKGLGKGLYGRLFPLLHAQGVANVLGGITLPNEASVRLHERLGFKQIATYRDVGFKVDRWWDVGWWQLRLQNPSKPEPLGPPVTRLD